MTKTNVYTSLPSSLRRQALEREVGIEYLNLCLRSWQDAGFNIISVNDPSELSDLIKLRFPVEYVPLKCERPKITDFLELIRDANEEIAGVINADCIFLGSSLAASTMREICKDSMVMLERINFSPSMRATGNSCYGFDAFIFDTKHLANTRMHPDLKLGDTWWDYWLPLTYTQAGGRLMTCEAPMLFHLDHPLRWKREEYFEVGRETARSFGGSMAYKPENNLSDLDISKFASHCFKHLKALSSVCSTTGAIEDQFKNSFWLGVHANARKNAALEFYFSDPAFIRRLEGPASLRIGMLLSSVATCLRPLANLTLSTRKLVERLYQIGSDLQLRAVFRDYRWLIDPPSD